MDKLKALLRMDPMTGALCAVVILVCAAFDTSMLAGVSQPNPNCPMVQAWMAGTWTPPPQTSTNCMGNIPNECICPSACGVVLCKP